MDNELIGLLNSEDFDELGKRLLALPADKLGETLSSLGEEDLRKVCHGLDPDVTAEFLLRIDDSAVKEAIVLAMRDRDLENVMKELSIDETVEIIGDLPSGVARKIAEEDEVLNLVEKRNFAVLKPLLSGFNSTDLAEIFDELPEEDIALVFRILPKDLAAETFAEMGSETKEHLITRLNDRELKAVMDEMFLDDAVDLIEEMPANVVKRIIAQSDAQTREYINELLNYPKDSAGSIMTIEFVSLNASMTVKAAFKKIRETGVDSETIYTLYVTDDKKKLIGTVSAKELMLSPPDKLIGDIMEENVIYVDTDTDKEDVSNTIAKYGFLALPVVDHEQRIVGIVTVDDAMQIMQDESTEDISYINAVTPSGTPYLKTGVFRIWLNRVPWLLILMISATFTGMIISHNEQVLNMPIYGILLTACIPMLMDTGGNAGSQASVTIIRGITLGEISFRDIGRVIWKEIRVAVLLGATLAIACFAKLMAIDRLYEYNNGYIVAAAICLTMMATIVLAKLVGCTLPLIVKKCHLDPAVVASPFITTIVDVLALSVYCAISIALLGSL